MSNSSADECGWRDLNRDRLYTCDTTPEFYAYADVMERITTWHARQEMNELYRSLEYDGKVS